MFSKQTISQEIIYALEKKGIKGRGSATYLASLCDVSLSAAGQWLTVNSPNIPTVQNLVKIAKDTDTSLDQLVFGSANQGKESQRGMIPILNFEEAIFFGEMETKRTEGIVSIPSLYSISSGFAVRMDDDSMMTQFEKSYPKGRIMVFNADFNQKNIKSGTIIFARMEGKESFGVCRQLIKIGVETQLAALNHRYNTDLIKSGKFKIKGILSYSIEEEEVVKI